jgi:hypothetical protein
VAGLLLVGLVLAAPAYQNLGQYSDFYDGGVYLESARMVALGDAPYRAVFFPQPPIWLELVRWSFAFFGQSMRSGQLLTVSSLVITAGAVGFIVLDGGVWLGAVLACATILLSPLAFFWAREITGELPAAAFAAVALALTSRYASDGRRLWLVSGALALACALLIKLFEVYAFAPALLILAERWKSAGKLRQRIWYMAADTLLALGIVFGVVAAVLLAYGPREVWTQAVAFHLDSHVGFSPARNWGLIAATLSRDPTLFSAMPLAACAVFEPWIGWAALAWFALTLVGLLIQQPLFTHHVVCLISANRARRGHRSKRIVEAEQTIACHGVELACRRVRLGGARCTFCCRRHPFRSGLPRWACRSCSAAMDPGVLASSDRRSRRRQ